jgi:hypothetical protein
MRFEMAGLFPAISIFAAITSGALFMRRDDRRQPISAQKLIRRVPARSLQDARTGIIIRVGGSS